MNSAWYFYLMQVIYPHNLKFNLLIEMKEALVAHIILMLKSIRNLSTISTINEPGSMYKMIDFIKNKICQIWIKFFPSIFIVITRESFYFEHRSLILKALKDAWEVLKVCDYNIQDEIILLLCCWTQKSINYFVT